MRVRRSIVALGLSIALGTCALGTSVAAADPHVADPATLVQAAQRARASRHPLSRALAAAAGP